MYSHTDNTIKTTIKQAIDGFLSNCKVEGRLTLTIRNAYQELTMESGIIYTCAHEKD
ncbi:unnamed protein product [marine sediment metagenome]|uniref:Uncharacterized protein n=1 Tax=marine sediment metagenome TaxID=412755 RepID=X0RS28_9ZZZZ